MVEWKKNFVGFINNSMGVWSGRTGEKKCDKLKKAGAYGWRGGGTVVTGGNCRRRTSLLNCGGADALGFATGGRQLKAGEGLVRNLAIKVGWL